MILKKIIGFKYLCTGMLSALVVTGYGQEVEKQLNAEQVQTMDSIDVVRDYRPVLADAVKVRRSQI
ncbi:hypothetical protein L950_0226375 [Sphingobacterium sp. IITKGP-BTPF85]|nr:hypothetical protein L950_0226375 [Sphingobacterium sp. IITKGP-BTPF85]